MNIQTKEKPVVSAVRLGASRQVVIPKKIHDRLKLAPGDYLTVELYGDKVVFTPKTLVNKGIEEGLMDLASGRIYGPFDSAETLARSLRGKKRVKRC